MPRPRDKSHPNETESEFVSRYIKRRNEEGEKDNKQNAAIAYSLWRNRNKKKKKSDTEIHRELLALDQIALDFEKEGNASAGRIITEAMRKIAEEDFSKGHL